MEFAIIHLLMTSTIDVAGQKVTLTLVKCSRSLRFVVELKDHAGLSFTRDPCVINKYKRII